MRRRLFLLAAYLILVTATGVTTAEAGCNPATDAPTIPAGYLALYQQWGEASGVPWQILAGVGAVETRHGLALGTNVPHDNGVLGPMQFQAGSNADALREDAAHDQGFGGTWGVWRASSGHPPFRMDDPDDEIAAAAAMLASDAGSQHDWGAALFAYNHLQTYVVEVETDARAYGWAGGASCVAAPAATDRVHEALAASADDILADPSVHLSPVAASDLAAGIVDQRVVAMLAWLGQRHHITVAVIKSGHAKYVAGTHRISNHWYGRAATITVVDGSRVRPSSWAAHRLWVEIAKAPAALAPDELGAPWIDRTDPRSFTDAEERTAIHVGWSGPTQLAPPDGGSPSALTPRRR